MVLSLKELRTDKRNDDRLIKMIAAIPYIEDFVTGIELIILHRDIIIQLTMIFARELSLPPFDGSRNWSPLRR